MEIDSLTILQAFAKQFNDLATAYDVHDRGPKIEDLDTCAGETLDDLFRICANMVAHGELSTNHLWLAVSADRGRQAACNTLAQFARALTIPPQAPTVVLAAPGGGAASPTRVLARIPEPSFPATRYGPDARPGGNNQPKETP